MHYIQHKELGNVGNFVFVQKHNTNWMEAAAGVDMEAKDEHDDGEDDQDGRQPNGYDAL